MKAQKRRHYLKYRDKYLQASRKQKAKDPERKRRADRARYQRSIKEKYGPYFRASLLRFGLTPEDYEAILASQGGGCAICGRTNSGERRIRRLAIDHDHKFARGDKAGVRGLLCGSCNNGLGRFRDNPENLRRAADYLKRHAESIRPRLVESA